MLPCLRESSIQLGTSKILYQKSFSYPSKSCCIKILPFKVIPARISLDFDLLFFLHHWRFHTVNTRGFTGPNSVAFFYQLISIPTGRKILHSNSSQHPLESPWMHQCTEIPPSTLEVCLKSVEKKKEVSYEDANKDIVKRKTSNETLVSTKLPYQRPFSSNRRDCGRWLCEFNQ